MPNKLGFIETCKRYYSYSTDAPKAFGEMLGIQLLGYALGYDAVHLIQPDAVRHNTYVLLVSESTLGRKSTAQKLAKKLLDLDNFLPEEMSPEQFVVELSEKSQAIQTLGEFTGLIKGATKKGGYMGRFVELYNDIHGCPEVYRRKLRGKDGKLGKEFRIDKTYLCTNSTVTPEMLEKYLTLELAEGGFLARWILVRGEPKPKPRGRLHEDVFKLNEALKYQLETIMAMDREVNFEFTDEALKRYQEIEEETLERKVALPFAGRYLEYLVAVADILVVSDAIGVVTKQGKNLRDFTQLGKLTQLTRLTRLGIGIVAKSVNPVNRVNRANRVIVDRVYVDRAWEILKPCLDYAEELLQFVGLGRPMAKLKRAIKKHKKIDHSTLMRNAKLDRKKMILAVTSLIDMKLVKGEQIITTTTKGEERVTTYYHWVGDGIE